MDLGYFVLNFEKWILIIIILNGKLEELLKVWSRFSVAMIIHHEQANLQEERFIQAFGARGKSIVGRSMKVNRHGRQSKKLKDHILNHSQKEQELRWGYKILKPKQRESLLPARPHLPNFSKQCPNTWAYEGHFSFKLFQEPKTLWSVLWAATVLS